MEDCKLPNGTFPTTTNIVRYEELSCLHNFITSLQQEQPVVKDPFDDEQFRRGYEAGKNDAMREQKPNKQTEIEIEEAAEKAALEFADQYPLENGEYGVAKISFMRGAEWQRQQGIVWSEKDEEKKAYDKGFKAAEEFYCGRII